MQKKIVLIGGPGTGKSTVVNELQNKGYECMPEISREITLKAQQQGIQQLFLTDPLLFSKMLLESRESQYLKANLTDANFTFFDRGLPDIHAYMEYTNQEYPDYFLEKSLACKYDYVFLFKPWKQIYISDNERYESFEEAVIIDTFLQSAYNRLGYQMITVPFGSVNARVNFILNWLNTNI